MLTNNVCPLEIVHQVSFTWMGITFHVKISHGWLIYREQGSIGPWISVRETLSKSFYAKGFRKALHKASLEVRE